MEDSGALAHLLHGYDVSPRSISANSPSGANERAEGRGRKQQVHMARHRHRALALPVLRASPLSALRLRTNAADRDLIIHLWQQLRSQLQLIGNDECTTILAQIAASAPEMR